MRRVWAVVFALVVCADVMALPVKIDSVMRLMASYPLRVCPEIPDSMVTYSYSKVRIQVDKRNVTLASVPTMFYLMRDNRRDFLTESYTRRVYRKHQAHSVEPIVYLSTLYHRKRALTTLRTYTVPTFYQPQLFADRVVSPFWHENTRYYRYTVFQENDSVLRLSFRSRQKNTQLLRRGWARINPATGRIGQFRLEGEYDMVSFVVTGEMGREGEASLFPKECTVQARFRFLGNRLRATFSALFRLPALLPDSVRGSNSPALMDSIRPLPLDSAEQRLAATYETEQADTLEVARDAEKTQRSWAKRVFWDMVGDNIFNRITAKLGDENQGYVRFSPLFNPLYMGYSGRKGLYYKFKMQGSYSFSDNQELSTLLRLGYSFKQNQMFFNLPLEWKFNKRRKGFVGLQFSNGNRITDSRVLDAIKGTTTRDTIAWDSLGLDYFKDTRFQISAGYDVLPSRLGVEVGSVFHRRSAVNHLGFAQAEHPDTYRSFAPFVKLSWRPLTDRVPLVVTMQYDQGLEWFSSNFHYSRLEFDAQYVRQLSRVRTLSLRAGSGFFLDRAGATYFLDYHNFREEYIPGGWNDEWTGDFELLNSNWYNASKYYVRANAAYESPMLLLSYVPLLGSIVEKERLYFSALAVSSYVPYVELGYSFTNRLFSMGIFTGFAPHHFDGIELKFGFELFNNW